MKDDKTADAAPEKTARPQWDKDNDKQRKPNEGAPPVGEQEEVNEPHKGNE